ncbi:MAG: cutinase family protein [Candidatus Saccharimonadales bacterium]
MAVFLPLTLTASDDTCADVLAIFARGSGQDEIGAGSDAEHAAIFFEELESRNDGSLTIETIDLDYPAAGIRHFGNAKFPWFPGNYRDSVANGINELDQQMMSRTHCTEQEVILGGFSQGAHVVGDTLDDIADYVWVESKIVGVGLFGDPKFNPSSYAAHGTFQAPQRDRFINSGGILGSRNEFPSIFQGRVESWCRYMDGICENSITEAIGNMPAHIDSYQNREIPIFINQVASKIDGLDHQDTLSYTPSFSEELDVMIVAENIKGNTHNTVLGVMAGSSKLADTLDRFDDLSDDTRFAYLGYGGGFNFETTNPNTWLKHYQFTRDKTDFMQSMSDETSYRTNSAHPLNALMKAFEYEWREDARKIIFLATNWRNPEEVETNTGYSLESVINTAESMGISIYPLSSSRLNPYSGDADAARAERYDRMASRTGGLRFPLSLVNSGAGGMLSNIANAIPAFPDIYNGKPGIVDEPGEEFIFDASGWINRDNIDPLRYRWNFTGGHIGFHDPEAIIYDDPTVYHRYDDPYQGFIRNRIQTTNWQGDWRLGTVGVKATMFIPVDIDPDRGHVPNINTPEDFKVIVDQGSFKVSWAPPDNAAPAQLRGYRLHTADGSEVLNTFRKDAKGAEILEVPKRTNPHILLNAISAQGESDTVAPEVTIITSEDDSDSSSGEDSEIDQGDISDSGNNEPDDLDNRSSDNNNHADDNLDEGSQESDNLDGPDDTDDNSQNNESEDSDNEDSFNQEPIFTSDSQNTNSVAEPASLIDIFLQDKSSVMKLISMTSFGKSDIDNTANVLGVDDQSKVYWLWGLLIVVAITLAYSLYRYKVRRSLT